MIFKHHGYDADTIINYEQNVPKKNTLLTEQNVEEKARSIIDKLFLYDANSENTLKLFVKRFHVRSKAEKFYLGI